MTELRRQIVHELRLDQERGNERQVDMLYSSANQMPSQDG